MWEYETHDLCETKKRVSSRYTLGVIHNFPKKQMRFFNLFCSMQQKTLNFKPLGSKRKVKKNSKNTSLYHQLIPMSYEITCALLGLIYFK